MLNRIIALLMRLSYKKITLDNVNKKLIKPVPGLIIDGVQYYQFVQIADMPQNRFVHYLQFNQEMSMGIDRKMLNDYIDAVCAANNKQDLSQIGNLMFMLRDTINNVTPVETLYNLASLLYFEQKEDISCYDLDYNAEKVKKFKAIHDKGFFFRTLIEQNLVSIGPEQPEDFLDYLSLSMVKLKAYAQMVSESTG